MISLHGLTDDRHPEHTENSPGQTSSAYTPPQGAPEILFADDALVIVNKPSGLLSVPGRGEAKQDCMVSRLQTVFQDALTVHRLDMETSGILLFARGPGNQRLMSLAFQQREVSKEYVALCDGLPDPQQGEIALPLITDWPNRPRQKVDSERGKPSLTRYAVLHYDAALNTSRIALEPLTGRSHQLRVHLMSIGHPILGDALYAPPEARVRSPRLMLHASSLRFAHPLSSQAISIHCPAPF